MNLKIHHIGYLVKDLEKSLLKFQQLGYKTRGGVTHDTFRGTDICFLRKDDYVVELVSPYDSSSVVSSLIKQYKNAPYHICYLTDNIEASCAELRNEGYVIIQQAAPAPAIDNRRVVFLMSHTVGIIELVEE